MRLKTTLLIILSMVVLAACQKKANTKLKPEESIVFNVKISKKIVEPQIISGFYGKVLRTEGDSLNEAEVSRTPILVYSVDLKEKIEAAKFEEKGNTYYNLKKLKKQGVLPTFRFVPNKSGFYQMDLGNGQFCILLESNKKKGYYMGGLYTIQSSADRLVEMNIQAK